MNHGSWGPSRPQSGYINGIGGRDAIAQNGKSIGRVCCNGHNSYPLPLTPIISPTLSLNLTLSPHPSNPLLQAHCILPSRPSLSPPVIPLNTTLHDNHSSHLLHLILCPIYLRHPHLPIYIHTHCHLSYPSSILTTFPPMHPNLTA